MTPFGFWYLLVLIAISLVIVWLAWAQAIGAGWSPTPMKVVDRMLEFAKVSENDTLYDLGSGDGRIVIRAAKKYGANAVGFELDPIRVWISRLRARSNGVGDKVRIVSSNLFDADLSQATVVSIFLTQKSNRRLKAKLMSLKQGTRVVTHTWTFDDWRPTIADSKLQAYLYVVP